MADAIASTAHRFASKWEPDPQGCWVWTGQVMHKGYGVLWDSVRQRQARAHRWSYEHFIGPIPEGMVIDHLCRNRSCVNPRHLEAVAPAENNRRGRSFSALNAAKVVCVRGHDLTDPSNVRLSNGRRHCRECQRGRQQPEREGTCELCGIVFVHRHASSQRFCSHACAMRSRRKS